MQGGEGGLGADEEGGAVGESERGELGGGEGVLHGGYPALGRLVVLFLNPMGVS